MPSVRTIPLALLLLARSAAAQEAPAAPAAAAAAPGGGTPAEVPAAGPVAPAVADGIISLPSPITFEPGAPGPDGPGVAALDALVAFLGAQPAITRLRVDVHVDETPAIPANTALARKRAAALKDLLKQRGLKAPRVEVSAAAPARLLAGSDSPGGRMRNTRVELVVLTLDNKPVLVPLARVVSASGNVSLMRAGARAGAPPASTAPAAAQDTLGPLDALETGANGRVELRVRGSGNVTVGPGARVVFSGDPSQAIARLPVRMGLERGWVMLGMGNVDGAVGPLIIGTAAADVAVRDSDARIAVSADGNQVGVQVNGGGTAFVGPAGKGAFGAGAALKPGQRVRASRGVPMEPVRELPGPVEITDAPDAEFDFSGRGAAFPLSFDAVAGAESYWATFEHAESGITRRVPTTQNYVDADALVPGTWSIHVHGQDADGFEGPAGRTHVLRVLAAPGALATTGTSPSRVARGTRVEWPAGVQCAAGSGAAAGSSVFARTGNAEVQCTLDGRTRLSAFNVSVVPVDVRVVEPVEAVVGLNRLARVEVRAGAALPAELTLEAGPGITAGPTTRTPDSSDATGFSTLLEAPLVVSGQGLSTIRVRSGEVELGSGSVSVSAPPPPRPAAVAADQGAEGKRLDWLKRGAPLSVALVLAGVAGGTGMLSGAAAVGTAIYALVTEPPPPFVFAGRQALPVPFTLVAVGAFFCAGLFLAIAGVQLAAATLD